MTRKQYGFLFLFLGLLFMHSVHSFVSIYRNNEITIYRIFGFSWGWNGAQRLSNEKIQKVFKQDKQARIQLAEECRRYKEKCKKYAGELPREIEDEQPDYMFYAQRNWYVGGLIYFKNSWSFPVAWQDETSKKPLTIVNETDKVLFIDNTDNPRDFSQHKQLKGIGPGQTRVIEKPDHKTLAFWRVQKRKRPIDQLLTISKIDNTSEQIRITKHHAGLKIITT